MSRAMLAACWGRLSDQESSGWGELACAMPKRKTCGRES